MKVLLANPPCRISINEQSERFFIRAGSRWPFSVVKKKTDYADYMPFPFYLAYTASLLEKEKNVRVFVEDNVALNSTEEEFLEKVFNIDPDIILIETATSTLKKDIQLLKKVKNKKKDIILGLAGFHVTALAEETFEVANGIIDFIMLREYEVNFLHLVQALINNKSLSFIKGIAYKEDDKIIKRYGELIDPIDQLPFPARHLFPSNEINNMSVYWDGFCQYKPAIQMHASRGCPFKCNFCVWNQVMYEEGKYRPRKAEFICSEIERAIAEYKAREIYFDDDTFTGSKKNVLNFCNEMIKRGLNKKVYWSAMADFMITDEEMIYKMKEAGCIGLKFGVESGNQKVLKRIEKPIRVERVKLIAKLCARMGIKTHGTFTFGLSGETHQTMQQTLDLAKAIDCDTVQFSITTPFPGTRYYEELKSKRQLRSNNWEDFDGNNNSVVIFESMDSNEPVKMRKKASGIWLRHKIKDIPWLLRQLYYCLRIIRGQGLREFFKRVWRGFNLIKPGR